MNPAGRYHDAVLANIHANDVDQAAEAVCKTPYGPDHNMGMLVSAASWSGEVCRSSQMARFSATVQIYSSCYVKILVGLSTAFLIRGQLTSHFESSAMHNPPDEARLSAKLSSSSAWVQNLDFA